MTAERIHRADSPSDAAALERLGAVFDDHAPALLRLVERLTGAGPHVEDVVQDVFLLAHQREGGLTDVDNVRGWLYAVAVNLSRNQRRRGRRREGLVRRYESDAAPAGGPVGPDEATMRREEGRLVRACVEALPARHREVIVLFELEGLDGQGVAAVLQIPVNTVWTRLKAAREKLRRLLVRRGLGGTT